MTDLDRTGVLAFRAVAHGLDRQARRASDVPGLDLGVQDSPPGAARLSLAARTTRQAPTPAAEDPARWDADPCLSSAWSLRGAPHVHRRADLPGLARALWPHDDGDTAARLAWNATRVGESGVPPLQALTLATAAVADVAAADPAELDSTGLPPVERGDGELGLSKGLLSREVTRRLPERLHRWCAPCGAAHLSEQLLRLATLPGGLAVESGSPLVFAPFGGPRWAPPAAPGDLEPIVRAYLHLYAPASPADVKIFLGTTLAVVAAHWPADAVAVRVAGRPAWALPEDLAALIEAPTPPAVRLLPPNDAFLKAGDRATLVPDKAQQKVIWRVLGSPGVLLLDGIPAGIWRPRTAGGRLDLAVEPFVPLGEAARADLAAEAERMAAVRGLTLSRPPAA